MTPGRGSEAGDIVLIDILLTLARGSEAVDIVIIEILLTLVRGSRLKQNVQESHVRGTSAVVTNASIEISEVGVRLPEWPIKVHWYE